MTKVQCMDVDKNFIETQLCRLKPVDRYSASFNLRAKLLQKVKKCLINGELLKKATTVYRPSFFINQTVDACAYMRNPTRYTIAGVVYNTVASYTNMNHSCPYEGIVMLKDFIVKYNNLDVPMPSGHYLLKLNYILNGQLRFKMNIYFVFEELKNGRRTYEVLT